MSTREIKKLLVANRGEIAIRIFRTCQKMGIATVAVFSDADEGALFVREADEAVRIGPAPSRDSYLRIDRILEAAKRTGADAIHPGFGFLAENDAFAQACADAGVIFVGPSPAAIRAMGLKREAKITALREGVPVVPGYSGEDQSSSVLAAEAKKIGYPILLKASAGGGGKGMRIVRSDDELEAAIEGARREAESAFGNGTLIIEKYVTSPRHVEIQILGDTHGNVVHLFERECSIQRRHQKIIEESPAPGLPAETRDAMGAAAVRLAKSIGYASAGTVEFVLDATGKFYFLEVNTRLQVEHPVTEGVVAGLDLVEEQIRVARGERLRCSQDELASRFSGAAMECRLCAEDPEQGFLPQSGRIVDFHVPQALRAQDWLRVETAVASGDSVPVHYDSMIAKLVTRGATRADALQRMRAVLSELSVQGITTNRAYLLRILDHPEMIAGRLDTHFIERHMGGAAPAPSLSAGEAALLATLADHETRRAERVLLPSVLSGYRNNRATTERVAYAVGEGELSVSYVALDRRGGFRARVDAGPDEEVRVVACDAAGVTVERSGLRTRARIVRDGDRVFVQARGAAVELRELPRFRDRDADAAADGCVAPMPGKIVKVLVEKGAQVEAGQTVIVMEAMKMEHAVKAPHAGAVTDVRATVGEQVDGGALLVVVEAAS